MGVNLIYGCHLRLVEASEKGPRIDKPNVVDVLIYSYTSPVKRADGLARQCPLAGRGCLGLGQTSKVKFCVEVNRVVGQERLLSLILEKELVTLFPSNFADCIRLSSDEPQLYRMVFRARREKVFTVWLSDFIDWMSHPGATLLKSSVEIRFYPSTAVLLYCPHVRMAVPNDLDY